MSAIDLCAAADLSDRVHLGPWKGELEFCHRQAGRCGPRVLELACGTGRLTVPLAAGGLTMTGLDLSAAMLARARSKAGMTAPRRPPLCPSPRLRPGSR